MSFLSQLGEVLSLLRGRTTMLAYVDPATTAMIIQIVAGVCISVGVALGIFRRKIALFFQGLKVKLTKKKIERENKKNENGDKN